MEWPKRRSLKHCAENRAACITEHPASEGSGSRVQGRPHADDRDEVLRSGTPGRRYLVTLTSCRNADRLESRPGRVSGPARDCMPAR
jgi:hypothetical protein